MLEWLAFSWISTIFVIWIVVVVWSDNKLLAFIILWFWPAAIVPLIQNWGVQGRDIRIPFALLLASIGYAVYQVSDSPAQAQFDAVAAVEQLRETDPERAKQIEEALAEEYFRASMEGREPDFSNVPEYQELQAQNTSGPSAKAPEIAAASEDGVDVNAAAEEAARAQAAAAAAQQLQAAVSQLTAESGTIELPEAGATLSLPAQFRFYRQAQIQPLVALMKLPALSGEIGWAVHAKTNLAAPNPWFVRVVFEPGRLALGNTDTLGADVLRINSSGQPSFSQGAFAPAWNAERGAATWGQRMLWGQHSVKPIAHGALIFSMQSPLSEPEELGIRATRLLAERTKAGAGFGYGEYDATTHGAVRGDLATFIARDRKL
jgi:hypothetical protein